jgi:HlyD family secretion protein
MNQLRRVGAVVANQGLRQAMTNLGHAQTELDRTQKLASSGSIPQVQLDDARRSADLSRSLETTAEAQQASSAPKGADTRVMLTSLTQAQAQLAAVTVRLAQTKILAQENSVVLTRTVEPGDVFQPSRTLLVLASQSFSRDYPPRVIQKC